jgi:hypothetical protein
VKNMARKQMVEDDEIENVGIMSGFMDDIEGLMEEIAQQELSGQGEDEDMARILGRSPDSPEILMNNLRGDYRSVDARREELADMVGYNAAQQTPDEVLAMLQPVLAQQGIGALPMGGADVGALPMDAMTGMPPGGQPPMDPAMMGGQPPMDPAMMGGQPPMDPAMMGGMPPQGIESLPMDQGAMPPLQMARGGIVQYFQDGSDEDGVTPFPMALTSSTRTVSQRMRDAAEDQMIQFMRQGPSPVRSLQEAMQDRVPMYEELLGVGDKDAMRANMLFDIAQTALGYAANVGPDGQPLRGSQAARLAGATRALPGQISSRVAGQQQQQQAVRMAALQAAEKELEGVRASNAALAKEQRQLMGTISTSETMGQASLTVPKAWGIVDAMPPKILDGTATPEEARLFETAMAIVTQAKEYIDPLTGQLVTSRSEVPAHAQDAAAVLNSERPEGAARVPSGARQTPELGRMSEPEDQYLPLSLRNPLTIANPRTEDYGQPGVASLFNAADNATGPVSTISAGLFRTPGLSALASQTAGQAVEARTFVRLTTNAIIEGFKSNTDRFTAEERRNLQSVLDTLPGLIDTPDRYRQNLFALDELLQANQEAALSRYRNTDLNMNARRAAQESAATIHEIRTLVGVPLHVNDSRDPRLMDIVRRYPVGTSFLVVNDPNVSGISRRTITQEMKDRVSGGQ